MSQSVRCTGFSDTKLAVLIAKTLVGEEIRLSTQFKRESSDNPACISLQHTARHVSTISVITSLPQYLLHTFASLYETYNK